MPLPGLHHIRRLKSRSLTALLALTAAFAGLALIAYGIAIERYSVFPHDLLSSAKRLVEKSLVDTSPLSKAAKDAEAQTPHARQAMKKVTLCLLWFVLW